MSSATAPGFPGRLHFGADPRNWECIRPSLKISIADIGTNAVSCFGRASPRGSAWDESLQGKPGHKGRMGAVGGGLRETGEST